jgi:hypothetical protein
MSIVYIKSIAIQHRANVAAIVPRIATAPKAARVEKRESAVEGKPLMQAMALMHRRVTRML